MYVALKSYCQQHENPETLHAVHLLFSQTRTTYDTGNHKWWPFKTAKNGKMETRGRNASLSYPYKPKKFGICQECQVTKHKASAMDLLFCMLSYHTDL